MTIRVGINGFGRIGRLALRALVDRPELDLDVVHINEIAGDAACMAHLTEFDSVHGRWSHTVTGEGDTLAVDGSSIRFTSSDSVEGIDWHASGVDVVIESTGRWRSIDQIEPHLTQGARRVAVAAPVKHESVLNIVMGVNDDRFDPLQHHIVTAASCTTNCLAPVVKALHEGLGIRRGTMTTMHDLTNTQSVVDRGDRDWRRARAASKSLAPTTTGSAKAIGSIFPELDGRLNGLAVRVPLLNASLTDFVFTPERPTTTSEVNEILENAANGALSGILGYETRPLVSVDYANDPRSSIIDAPSTMVIDDELVKVMAWYDNEWGYANRLVELVAKIGRA
ncbi:MULTISPECIES: ArsJ-associated glyceraldehyde-3-phosphate dehydrogenase [unclassified Guyparkeria]|uniref:ArsJ-associated glyceraldehyde-3-phosphate dehydrogenase n=1 Tax=unclassified Guyparkeria TaxID=2626246 RepID=UPI000733615C|nr:MULTISPECIES: ArsJ-associated glyceraldehyde-3-phosphate dehydrogenase [unclassified Guyparkeria]KTG17776.1 glyceraldehyde-3-phosphate dehydrogenase [Guyparkeria sp. XI15]OAE89487.1 glyceraldehyde-3-phosphate dehydrogenase [Guyparkeria sp. WRN-7]